MHGPMHSQMRLKDEIARELLDEREHGAGIEDPPVTGHRGADPDFLNDDCETAVDILTGAASPSE